VEARAVETRTYEISYAGPDKIEQLEQIFKTHKLYIRERKNLKRDGVFICHWQVDGRMPQHHRFVNEILKDPDIKELRY
jgi:hypothetical protein